MTGIIQQKMMEGFQEVLAQGQEQSKKDVAQVTSLMEQIKDLLKEIQLCNNNNFYWVMGTLQAMADKQGIKLDDPWEK